MSLLNVQMRVRRRPQDSVLRATFLGVVNAEEEQGGGEVEVKSVPDFESCGAVWVRCVPLLVQQHRRRHARNRSIVGSVRCV